MDRAARRCAIPLQEIENARDRCIDVYRTPDGVFRRAIPSTQDS